MRPAVANNRRETETGALSADQGRLAVSGQRHTAVELGLEIR